MFLIRQLLRDHLFDQIKSIKQKPMIKQQTKASYSFHTFIINRDTNMQRQQPASDQQINFNKQSTETIAQYSIWLSPQAKIHDLYLTIKGNGIIIGSKQGDQKEDIIIDGIDFIGFNEEQAKQDWLKITLNTFQKKKKLFRNPKRYLIHYPIYIYMQQFSNTQVQSLKCHLLTLATNKPHKKSTQTLKLMIYFNPKSGSNSKKHFQNILNFLSYTNVGYDVLQTQRQGHCKEHIDKELEFGKYHGVVIVSGDGLMHEFVNSRAVGVLPVTHVPAGSGNAFAKYQMTLAGEVCQDEEAIYLAIKGKTKKLNLVEFNLQKVSQPIFSFLSFEWCFMADIDMNSEFLRFLGGLRFEIYGLWRLLKVRRYKGKLSYSKTSTNLPPLNEEITDNETFSTQQKTYLHQIITFIPWISTSYQISPLLQLQDQSMDLQQIPQQAGKLQLTKYMLNCQSGNHFDKDNKKIKEGYMFEWEKIRSFRLEPNGEDMGVFGIDGEKYEAQKVQAKISDRKILAFV